MASRARFTVPDEIPERTSWTYSARLVDGQGQAIPRAAINTLLLTLYLDNGAKPIINNVTAVNILNVDRGVVGETDGSLRINFRPDDSQIIDDTATTEVHVALVRCTYNGAQDAFSREIGYKVRNLARLT